MFRFALPPSIGPDQLTTSAERLRTWLETVLQVPCDVTVSQNYEVLSRNIVSGAVDAAWAPPFVCAQSEAAGARVIVQSKRFGQTSYASAFVARRGDSTQLSSYVGKTIAWVDPHSVAGHLLPLLHLKQLGMFPERTFKRQAFAGSYKNALRALLDGTVDLTCVHAIGQDEDSVAAAADAHLDGAGPQLSTVAMTQVVPADGVVVRDPQAVESKRLSAKLLTLHRRAPDLLRHVFFVEEFAPVQQGVYRDLYKVAPP